MINFTTTFHQEFVKFKYSISIDKQDYRNSFRRRFYHSQTSSSPNHNALPVYRNAINCHCCIISAAFVLHIYAITICVYWSGDIRKMEPWWAYAECYTWILKIVIKSIYQVSVIMILHILISVLLVCSICIEIEWWCIRMHCWWSFICIGKPMFEPLPYRNILSSTDVSQPRYLLCKHNNENRLLCSLYTRMNYGVVWSIRVDIIASNQPYYLFNNYWLQSQTKSKLI